MLNHWGLPLPVISHSVFVLFFHNFNQPAYTCIITRLGVVLGDVSVSPVTNQRFDYLVGQTMILKIQ